jgi:hypothetical protein
VTVTSNEGAAPRATSNPAPKPPMNSDHVVLDSKKNALACRHCGAERALLLPQPIRVVVRATQVFLNQHEACPKPTGAAS